MIHKTIRRVALMIPQVRSLVESRDAALAARDLAISKQHTAETALAATIPQLRELAESRDAALAARDLAVSKQPTAETAAAAAAPNLADLFHRFLKASAPDTWLQLELNDAVLWLPRDTLLTMFHCIHRRTSGELFLSVEQNHLNWMMQHLTEGGAFLDVGAATGATTLPIAARFGDAVRITCYEPAEAARKLLLATLEHNQFSGPRVLASAVSDVGGTAEFREFLPDETGETPYLPEASTLIAKVISDRPHRTITVPVVTLDDNTSQMCDRKPMVIKIDVEGFEAQVLRGGRRLISDVHPWLSIDIHRDPFGDAELDHRA